MTKASFDDITERLDQIIAQVRSKETSLERSLDLFDEAIELGSRAVDMVDSFELSDREAEMLDSEMTKQPDATGSNAQSTDASEVSQQNAKVPSQSNTSTGSNAEPVA